HRHPPGAHLDRAASWQGGHRDWLPGRHRRPGCHHARPRRLRYDRCRARVRAQRRALRHLHRRGGHLHRGPAHRALGQEAGADRPGIAAAIFEPLAAAGVSVDTIAQSSGADGMTDLTFTISRGDLDRALDITRSVAPSIHAASVDTSDSLGKVSIVGTGMQSAPGYAARMFGTLARAGVNIDIISTSDI